MAIIVTYDVPQRHTELKEALLKAGYRDKISGTNCKTIYFPNTTLFHHQKTAEVAREDVKAECRKLGIDLDRCVATQWGPNWAAVCGEPFK